MLVQKPQEQSNTCKGKLCKKKEKISVYKSEYFSRPTETSRSANANDRGGQQRWSESSEQRLGRRAGSVRAGTPSNVGRREREPRRKGDGNEAGRKAGDELPRQAPEHWDPLACVRQGPACSPHTGGACALSAAAS